MIFVINNSEAFRGPRSSWFLGVAANLEKVGSMPQLRDVAALNRLRCSLTVLLSLRGLSSTVVNIRFSHGAFAFVRG